MIERAWVNESLNRWTPIGHNVIDDGTELIGRIPHVAPFAWLHYLFAPVGNIDIEFYCERILNFKYYNYKNFLLIFNGVNLFSKNLYLLERRTSYRRDGSIHQPWELSDTNLVPTEEGAPPYTLIIGGSNAL